MQKDLRLQEKLLPLQSRKGNGAVAQVVEQWTENPCVAGSTPASTTLGPLFFSGLFCFYFWDTAVSRTEDASGAAGGCPQSVESAVLRAFEDASRTPGACFWHRISIPYRRRFFVKFRAVKLSKFGRF